VNYQKAIELVLLDGLQCKWFHEQKEFEFVCVTIIVVGAGRGPLIQASLDAVDEVNSLLRRLNAAETIQVKVIAVEKNSCAVSYLRSYLSTQPRWQSSVSIVQCDIRFAQQDLFLSKIIHGTHNHKADIVVSELLGSFGDNELSPECLDGVQRSGLLKNTCVSIPQSYTSYLAPLTSMRLHAEAQAQAFLPSDQSSGPLGKPCGILQAMETPYVVRPHAASQIHDEKPCWTFHHFHSNVNKDAEDNVRYSQVTFSPDANLGRQCGSGYGSLADLSLLNLALDSTHNEYDLYIHGFLGTFSCVLYRSLRDSQISTICTAPNLFTSGMFSWFPLFFPLRESMLVPVNSTIACNIWRRTETETSADRGRVWYEWCADVRKKDGKIISSSVLHNPNGRSSHVRL
jgi:protein arginine N-methyltransferase 5